MEDICGMYQILFIIISEEVCGWIVFHEMLIMDIEIWMGIETSIIINLCTIK